MEAEAIPDIVTNTNGSSVFSFGNILMFVVFVIISIGLYYLVNNFFNFEKKELSFKTLENSISNLPEGIVLIYTMDGCPFCEKMSTKLEENKDKIKLKIIKSKSDGIIFGDDLDKLTQEEKEEVSSFAHEVKHTVEGFPFSLRKIDEKINALSGFPSDEDFNGFFNIS